MVLDLLLFDLGLHLQKGNSGATRGRSYMKDKSVAEDQDVFGMAKLLFDDTSLPYQSGGDAGATLFARAHRYRLPAVLLRVARSHATSVDRERMGVPIDPHAPVTANPVAPYGYTFDDPANIPFWWERGALTAWQVVPTTIAELDRYNLWESDFFSPFKPLADIAGGDPAVARTLAQALASQISFGLLSEVNTITFRSPSVMLSTAQSWRPGDFSEQAHISQATLDEHAIVFTTHPKNEPQSGTQWPDSDGYWTGTGSLPRAAQHGAVSMSLYAPNFAPSGPPLDSFSYLDYTHAYFPQERFDEVVQADGWTFGKRGDGYVALWSWRPTHWRTYDDPGIFTHGLTRSFDLVADGGADNTWITQVGDAQTFGSFEQFRDAVLEPAGAGRTARGDPDRTPGRLRRGVELSDRGPADVRHDDAAHGEGRDRTDRQLPPLRQPVEPHRVRLPGREDRRPGEHPRTGLRHRSPDRQRPSSAERSPRPRRRSSPRMSAPDLAGRVIIVTGASRGIGKGLALGYAEAGAHRRLRGPLGTREPEPSPRNDRRDGRRDQSAGGRAIAVRCDIGIEADLHSLVARTVDEYGRVDSLMNNAMAPTPASFDDSTVEMWDESMRVNVRSLFILTKLVEPHMTAQGGGSIVNMSSHGADHAVTPFMPPGYLTYSVAKSAMERFTTALAPELVERGITVNALRPGAVKTELTTLEYGEDHDWTGWSGPEAVVPAANFLAAQIATDFTGRVVDAPGFGVSWP